MSLRQLGFTNADRRVRWPDARRSSVSDAAYRGIANSMSGKWILRAPTLHKQLHTHLATEFEQVDLNTKPRRAGFFAEPSDGLEPSTPG
jgi:hypothetical protein